MTEQPVETEQAWLGNASRIAPRVVQPAGTAPVPPAPTAAARQHYAPNAHRIHAHPIAELAPEERSGLATKFLGAIDTAFDKADESLAGRRTTDAGYHRPTADAIFRTSVTAAAKLLKARAVAKQAEDALAAAEDALSQALAVENLAEIDSCEADRTLFEFVREVAAQ